MIPVLHPLMNSLVATGETAAGLEYLVYFLLYGVLLVVGLVLMIFQVAALVWAWRTSRRQNGEEQLRTRWDTILMVMNWVWLGILASLGYWVRELGPLWAVWLPLTASAAVTVLHLMALHRHTAVSFALLVGVLVYTQVFVPTVTTALLEGAHKQKVRDLLSAERVANRERLQQEEFGRQQARERSGLISRWIDESLRSLERISVLITSGTLGDEQRKEVQIFFIDRVHACHALRQSLKSVHAYDYPDRYGLLKRYIDVIVSWNIGPQLEGQAAEQVEALQRYVQRPVPAPAPLAD